MTNERDSKSWPERFRAEGSAWEQYGRRFVGHRAAIGNLLDRFSDFAMDSDPIAPGERVLDYGCGCGDTTVSLARRVGSTGRVVGVDVSEVMLEQARATAARLGLTHVGFELANVETQTIREHAFDLVFSRFGVMFFENPVVAFSRMRGLLTPNGRLNLICWQPLEANEWMKLHVDTLAPILEGGFRVPAGPTGPFAFGDPARIREILAAAGFGSIGVRSFRPKVALFGIRELVEFVDFVAAQVHTWFEMEQPRGMPEPALAALRKAYRPHWTSRGVVMRSAVWIVTAKVGSPPATRAAASAETSISPGGPVFGRKLER
jgi:SAM-dependent methyltransferase